MTCSGADSSERESRLGQLDGGQCQVVGQWRQVVGLLVSLSELISPLTSPLNSASNLRPLTSDLASDLSLPREVDRQAQGSGSRPDGGLDEQAQGLVGTRQELDEQAQGGG